MKIKNCKYCDSGNLILEPRITGQDVLTADMVSLRCKDCGKWLKWCPKDERTFYYSCQIDLDHYKGECLNLQDEQNQKAIEQLEKVKNEIEFLGGITVNETYFVNYRRIRNYLDQQIKELKGENK